MTTPQPTEKKEQEKEITIFTIDNINEVKREINALHQTRPGPVSIERGKERENKIRLLEERLATMQDNWKQHNERCWKSAKKQMNRISHEVSRIKCNHKKQQQVNDNGIPNKPTTKPNSDSRT